MNRTEAAASDVPHGAADRWNEVAAWATKNSSDILLAVLIGLVIASLLYLLRRVGHRLIRDRDASISWRTIFGRVLAKTSLFFIIACAAKLVSSQTDAPYLLRRTIDIAFTVATAVQAAVWARELILGFIQHRVGDEEAHRALGSAIGIIRLLVTVALFAIAIILILDNLGVNVTGLVAGLGIGGIAIGLAAQGIFSDLFAALSIIFDKPFSKGDVISFGSPPTTGVVEHIGLKSTRIRSLGGEEVVMANTKLLEQQLQNWTLLRQRRAVMTFGLVYQTSPDLLAQVPLELKAIVEAQPLAEFDRCHAFQFGASSIDFELVFHVESTEMYDFMAVRQAVMLGMIRRFAEIGAEFAYPTQTTFTAAPDGTLVMPYAPPKPA
ncbi:MAG TPA: mechanosensitive ion channel family protein [Allosphingosinicella sp.]|nr:mechanosensitive ion channel family protein [Allosphingosinicella sp.]